MPARVPATRKGLRSNEVSLAVQMGGQCPDTGEGNVVVRLAGTGGLI